jgi:hypothetical protein
MDLLAFTPWIPSGVYARGPTPSHRAAGHLIPGTPRYRNARTCLAPPAGQAALDVELAREYSIPGIPGYCNTFTCSNLLRVVVLTTTVSAQYGWHGLEPSIQGSGVEVGT